MLPAVVLALCLAFKKEFRLLIGMATTCFSLLALNLGLFGTAVMSRWLNGFLMGDRLFADTANYPQIKPMIFGLPRAILYWLPAAWTPWLKVPVYAVCSTFALSVMYVAAKLGRANLTDSRTLAMVASLAAVAGPLFTPHFFYHDLTLLLMPFLLLGTQTFEDAGKSGLKVLAWFGWLVLFISGMFIQFYSRLSTPIFVCLAVLYVFRQLWVLCKLEKRSQVAHT